jgi:hypothetical protein
MLMSVKNRSGLILNFKKNLSEELFNSFILKILFINKNEQNQLSNKQLLLLNNIFSDVIYPCFINRYYQEKALYNKERIRINKEKYTNTKNIKDYDALSIIENYLGEEYYYTQEKINNYINKSNYLHLEKKNNKFLDDILNKLLVYDNISNFIDIISYDIFELPDIFNELYLEMFMIHK